MESVAHSRQRNKVGITLSNNNGTLSGKSLYDDVYGGPPKFGVSNLSPRFEDYSEIFGSFHTARASSIPVLDLPAVHETEAFFDPRSDTFNYTDVFCALDFAVSYENLFHQHCGLDGVSYEEAWTPAETGSCSGESDHSANNQSMLNGDVFHSIDGNTEFNISYHKASGTSNEHRSKGKTHMTQLHAVPDFSRVYDETTKLHQTDPSFQVANDIEHDMEFSAGKVKGNHLRKTMPRLHNVTSGEQTFDSDIHLQNGCSRNDSHSSEMFVTVSDISLRSMPSQVPPPSRPPPVLDAKKGDIHRFHSNGRLVASEETPSGAGSPPFFDVEDGMNLSDTASADAMKEAMLRAEAKLRSAKQLKERKKGVYERHAKSSDEKINEAKMCEDSTGLNSLNDETMQESCGRQKLRKASPETLDILEGKRVLNMIKEKNKTESRSSPESDRSTGVGTQKEESEFFELVGMEESGMVIEPTKQSNILVQGTGTEKHGQKEREASNVQEKHKKVKAAEENYWGQEYEKNSKAAKKACEHNENIIKSKASNEKWRQTEYMEKEKMVEVFELEENEKSIRMVHKHGNSEKKVTEVDQSGILEDVCEMGHKEHKEVEIQKPKEVDRQAPNGVQSVKRHRQYEKTKENGKMQTEAFAPGQTGDEKKLNDSVELGDIDERSNVAFELDNNTQEKETCRRENEMKLKLANQIQINKELKEAHEKVEIEKTSWGSSEDEVSNKGLIPALGRDENEKQHKEGFELEVNEITLKEAFMQRENEAYEQDQSRKKFEYICDGYGEGNRHQEAGDNKGVQKVLNQTPEKEQFDGMLNEANGKKVTKSTSNQTFSMEGNVTVSNKNSHLKQSKHTGKYVGEMERNEGLDKTLDGMGRNEKGENIKIAKSTDATWEIESDEDLAAKSASIYEEIVGKVKVSKESVADHEIGKMRTECKVGEKKLKKLGVENQLANEKIRVPEMTTRDVECSGTQSEKVDDDTMTKDDYRRSMEAVEPASLQESVNVLKTPQRFCVGQSTESKEKIINETPATVVKDDEKMRRESGKVHLGKIEGERDREREREKDRMAVDKAMLEADREREREKDRIAVDGATFEARDRAYDEACERAERAAFERATVEARHKALAEARERLEKACAEARDKSYIHKATTEARLKAERAAVERATAEAQERAMEKLKNGRTAYESREWLERSVSDNFGVCFRDGGRQDSTSSDSQFQNFSSSTGSRHPYSLYGAASFSERSEREGESAQRCRARLERHRRTAERAAKALAEKNMRDLLVQKEQAERNRLAETLDAEVRRWSSGKEGNLRALLSTLQYILGPDSGWQPIPLTEVITSAAVKKAYRKATLCVHPDKLQQRGASIQHKYICEKVFDLLKEAWNKFNSEER